MRNSNIGFLLQQQEKLLLVLLSLLSQLKALNLLSTFPSAPLNTVLAAGASLKVMQYCRDQYCGWKLKAAAPPSGDPRELQTHNSFTDGHNFTFETDRNRRRCFGNE